VFNLRPLGAVPGASEKRPLSALFSRKGRVFARAVLLVPISSVPALDELATTTVAALQNGDPFKVGTLPDLYLEIISLGRLEKPDGELDTKDRFIFQARVGKKNKFPVGGDKIELLKDLDAFLKERYASLAGLGRRVDDPAPNEADRVATAAAVRDFGAELWKRYTPKVVKDSIRALQRQKPTGADILLHTNDPRLPLELVLVPVSGKGDCGPQDHCELLGVLHRVSRWHVQSDLDGNSGVRIRAGKVAVVAPTYGNKLEAVTKEFQALQRLAGVRFVPVDARFMPFVQSLGAKPLPAVLHYAGHGKARPGALPGVERYALRLEDRELDLATFRQHAVWTDSEGAGGPLVFLNACEVGRAEGTYGWVDGWGPAALVSGAAGFVGGLWALGDAGAEVFMERFYENALAGVPVAEAVRRARSAYVREADPTLVAYVYYGDPELRLTEKQR
jgi:hypothetical protein